MITKEILGLVITFASIMLAGNGVIVLLIKRRWSKADEVEIKKDKVDTLCHLNNKQGHEIVLLSDTMANVLGTQQMLVKVLHDKKVLNGESEIMLKKLSDSRTALEVYAKREKDEQLFVKE